MFFKIIYNKVKIIIREGIIYPTPSNLNNFKIYVSLLICFVTGQMLAVVLVTIYYFGFSGEIWNFIFRFIYVSGGSLILLAIYMCIKNSPPQLMFIEFFKKLRLFIQSSKNASAIRSGVFIVFIIFITFKILMFALFPQALFFRAFIFTEAAFFIFVILVYFKSMLPYLVGAVGFHIPIYVFLCKHYATQVVFIEYEIINYGWVFNELVSDEALSLYVSFLFFSLYIIKFRVDLGFCKPNFQILNLEESKNKLVFTLLFLLAIILRILIELDCPWVFFPIKNYKNIEICLLLIIFFRVSPIFILSVIVLALLCLNLVISKIMLILLFMLILKMYSFYLLYLIIICLFEEDYISKTWNVLERMSFIISILFIINIFFYLLISSNHWFTFVVWLIVDQEEVDFLKLASLYPQDSISSSNQPNKGWLDRMFEYCFKEFKTIFSEEDEEEDREFKKKHALKYFYLDGKYYEIIANVAFWKNGTINLIVDDKYSVSKFSLFYGIWQLENFLAVDFVNSLINIRPKVYNIESMTQIFCFTFLLFDVYRSNKNIKLVSLLCILLTLDIILFDWLYLFQASGYGFNILIIDIFLLHFWLIWIYFLGELIFLLIRLILYFLKKIKAI